VDLNIIKIYNNGNIKNILKLSTIMKGFLRKLKKEKKIQFIGNFFKDTKRAI
jgi:hypothetical protein